MQKITPFLWFDGNAEEAVDFYTSVFKNSKVNHTVLYTEAGPGRPGDVMLITFQLEDQDFMALNGGSEFRFNPAVSLVVDCKDQDEVDTLWDKLSDGGKTVQCGWLEDKFGVSWQIVPSEQMRMLEQGTPAQIARNMEAMFKMVKLDLATLKQAYEQS